MPEPFRTTVPPSGAVSGPAAPAISGAYDHSSVPRVPSVAAKINLLLATTSSLGDELPAGAISATSVEFTPSVDQSSRPVALPSVAPKYSRPPRYAMLGDVSTL